MKTEKANKRAIITAFVMFLIIFWGILADWRIPYISATTFEIIMIITFFLICFLAFEGELLLTRIFNAIGYIATFLGIVETIIFISGHFFA